MDWTGHCVRRRTIKQLNEYIWSHHAHIRNITHDVPYTRTIEDKQHTTHTHQLNGGVTVDTHFYFLFTQGKHWTWFCVIAWQKELSVTSHPSHITFMFYTNAHTTRHTYNSIFAEFLHYIIHVYNLHRIYIFTYITYTRTTYTMRNVYDEENLVCVIQSTNPLLAYKHSRANVE